MKKTDRQVEGRNKSSELAGNTPNRNVKLLDDFSGGDSDNHLTSTVFPLTTGHQFQL